MRYKSTLYWSIRLMVRTVACHATNASSILAWTVASHRVMRLCSMNYKDALTHPINDKLTKAKLIEISRALQNQCLADELTVIPMHKYYIDIRTRWQTHLNETRLLIKDVVNLGRNTRQVLVTAMNNMD